MDYKALREPGKENSLFAASLDEPFQNPPSIHCESHSRLLSSCRGST